MDPITDQKVVWGALFDNGAHEPEYYNHTRVEWMQFIHNVNRLIRDKHPEIDFSIFSDDTDTSKLGGFGTPNQLGRGLHDRSANEHWSGFEIYPDWIVYLDGGRKEALIECHNPDLVAIAIKAATEVFG